MTAMSGGHSIHMRMVEPQMTHTRIVKVTATTIAAPARHRVVGSARVNRTAEYVLSKLECPLPTPGGRRGGASLRGRVLRLEGRAYE